MPLVFGSFSCVFSFVVPGGACHAPEAYDISSLCPFDQIESLFPHKLRVTCDGRAPCISLLTLALTDCDRPVILNELGSHRLKFTQQRRLVGKAAREKAVPT